METTALSPSSVTFLLLISALAALVVFRVFRRIRISSESPRRLEISIGQLGGFS